MDLPQKFEKMDLPQTDPALEFVRVCSIEDVPPQGRKRVAVTEQERDVTLFNVKGEIYAMDSVCYHMGGPLIDGDIEDFGGHTCIVCPWHRYKIQLSNGEGFYAGLDKQVCSKGIKQRVHEVKVVPGDGVYVRLSSGERLPSDHYAYMGLHKKSTGGGARVHSSLPLRSGHVLSGAAPTGSSPPASQQSATSAAPATSAASSAFTAPSAPAAASASAASSSSAASSAFAAPAVPAASASAASDALDASSASSAFDALDAFLASPPPAPPNVLPAPYAQAAALVGMTIAYTLAGRAPDS
eukprot:TRINITY_DN8780_c0_g4_i1.p1 TRINITY_DN8780_c0_g4~~TRINITY_DN8780_c0_g4_i1.p1  ORF type:complete len:298 (+),score=40.02 TRINITY_DN8780_c0_g4_i1:235-1128(+)